MRENYDFKANFADLESFVEAFVAYAYLRGKKSSFPSWHYRAPWHKFLYEAVGMFPQLRELSGSFETTRGTRICVNFEKIHFRWIMDRFNHQGLADLRYAPISHEFLGRLKHPHVSSPELPEEVGERLVELARSVDGFFKEENDG